MKASRKDFAAIAELLKANLELIADRRLRFAHETLCMGIANVLAESNPAFQRQRFMTACGH